MVGVHSHIQPFVCVFTRTIPSASMVLLLYLEIFPTDTGDVTLWDAGRVSPRFIKPLRVGRVRRSFPLVAFAYSLSNIFAPCQPPLLVWTPRFLRYDPPIFDERRNHPHDNSGHDEEDPTQSFHRTSWHGRNNEVSRFYLLRPEDLFLITVERQLFSIQL